MPFIKVMTNEAVAEDKQESVKSALGQAITAIPGKTEAWLMVGIEPEYRLWFKGDSSPAAMVEVSVFGSAPASAYNELTAKICGIMESELGIPQARVYVKYTEVENWGWNGSNF